MEKLWDIWILINGNSGNNIGKWINFGIYGNNNIVIDAINIL